MGEPILTILTPTWNRQHLLPRLHASLMGQGDALKQLEWLVVDDGSTDGTFNYVSDLARRSDFSIRALRQDNGGKHRAVNTGVRTVISPWTLILDSDDWIVPDGLCACLEAIGTDQENPRVTGIISDRLFDGSQSRSPRTSEVVNFAVWKRQYSRCDTAIVVRTSALTACPFPEFAGENFVAESAVWSRIFKDGGIRLSDIALVGAEYQTDGLSANSRRLRSTSPLGAMFTYGSMIDAGNDTARNRINYSRFKHHARHQDHVEDRSALAAPLCSFLGWLIFLRDRQLAGSADR